MVWLPSRDIVKTTLYPTCNCMTASARVELYVCRSSRHGPALAGAAWKLLAPTARVVLSSAGTPQGEKSHLLSSAAGGRTGGFGFFSGGFFFLIGDSTRQTRGRGSKIDVCVGNPRSFVARRALPLAAQSATSCPLQRRLSSLTAPYSHARSTPSSRYKAETQEFGPLFRWYQ